MKLILIRHLEPNFQLPEKATCSCFNKAFTTYLNAPIKTINTTNLLPKVKPENYNFYCSTSQNCSETLLALFGNVNFTKTTLLNEITLFVPETNQKELTLSSWRKKALKLWKKQNHFTQNMEPAAATTTSPRSEVSPTLPETQAQTEHRAKELLLILEKEGKDVALVSHLFFLKALIRLLKKSGYELTRQGFFSIKYGERLRAETKAEHCGGCKYNCILTRPNCELGRDKALLRNIKIATDKPKRF